MVDSHSSSAARKGARSMAEIPAHTLQALENGSLPTANLVESLAVNQAKLAIHVLNRLNFNPDFERRQALHQAQNLGFLQRCKTIAGLIQQQVQLVWSLLHVRFQLVLVVPLTTKQNIIGFFLRQGLQCQSADFATMNGAWINQRWQI
jgi:hypothetical protein